MAISNMLQSSRHEQISVQCSGELQLISKPPSRLLQNSWARTIPRHNECSYDTAAEVCGTHGQKQSSRTGNSKAESVSTNGKDRTPQSTNTKRNHTYLEPERIMLTSTMYEWRKSTYKQHTRASVGLATSARIQITCPQMTISNLAIDVPQNYKLPVSNTPMQKDGSRHKKCKAKRHSDH